MNEILVLNVTKDELKGLIAEVVECELSKLMLATVKNRDKEYLCADEVCAMYHMSKSTLYKLTSSRTIPSMKTGKRLLLKKSDMDCYIELCRRKSVTEIRNSI